MSASNTSSESDFLTTRCPLRLAALLVLILLGMSLGLTAGTTQASPGTVQAGTPVPVVSLDAPGSVFLGQTFTFGVTFSN